MDQPDTIPRLQNLPDHMLDQLTNLLSGATFEQCRLRYTATVDRLAAAGKGRKTASRVGDRDAYWSPTADLLAEAMRMGFVERGQKLPSARRYVDAHRDRSFSLTEKGAALATLAERDLAAFYDELTDTAIAAHPHLRALVAQLEKRPLVCPEVSEGSVEAARKAGKRIDHWVDYFLDHSDGGSALGRDVISDMLAVAIRRRFGTEPPTSKALSEALNDAFAATTLKTRGLNFGATDLSILRQWGMQLRVLDQSRYVPDYQDANVVWLAAEVVAADPPKLERRGFAQHAPATAKSVLNAYDWYSAKADSSLSAPYAPIYIVRAAAAFERRVTRALVDLVIERLADGSLPTDEAKVQLHLGTTNQPRSEPVFRSQGARRYEITVHRN